MRLALLMVGFASCGAPAVPVFAADYTKTFVEVRNCRSSTEHDLNNIRVLADPQALGPYQSRDAGFPNGAVVLKEEYDYGDTSCSGPVKQWTVMVRHSDSTNPKTLGWRWQWVDKNRHVVTTDEPRCFNCHTSCGVAPDGYEATCAVP